MARRAVVLTALCESRFINDGRVRWRKALAAQLIDIGVATTESLTEPPFREEMEHVLVHLAIRSLMLSSSVPWEATQDFLS